MRSPLFFYLSGEHESLPRAEIEAIIEAEGFDYRRLGTYPRMLSVEADDTCLKRVVDRSSYLRTCAMEIYRCHPTRDEIVNRSRDVMFDKYLSKGDAFSVRVRRVHPTKVNTLRIERFGEPRRGFRGHRHG
jgi:tRNA (guanine10-N2)-dimethyltransferase